MRTVRPSLAHKPLLSVEEVAILLGQSRSSLYRSIERGDLPLPVFKLSGRWRVPRRAVERLLEGDLPVMGVGASPEAGRSLDL